MMPYLPLLIVLGILFNGSALLAQATSPDLIAQAKKEGRVTWYTTVSIPEAKQLIDMFEKQYPFIKVDLLRSGSGFTRLLKSCTSSDWLCSSAPPCCSTSDYSACRARFVLRRWPHIFFSGHGAA